MTYFDLFGLPASVDLDLAALERRHRELAVANHPDRVLGADASARRRAAEMSATLNDALKTLRDPARRAGYLLKLGGFDLDHEASSEQVRLSGDRLAAILDRREALEALKAARDLPGARALAEAERREAEAALTQANDALRRRDLPRAAQALASLRYNQRLIDDVEAFEEEFAS